jgi:hypothetical protein
MAVDSFTLAADVCKQIISLSTGVMALLVTYSNSALKNPSRRHRTALLQCGVFFLIAIFFGLLSLMAMTGTAQTSMAEGVYAANIRILSGLEFCSFIAALGLTIRFGLLSIRTPGEPVDKEPK